MRQQQPHQVHQVVLHSVPQRGIAGIVQLVGVTAPVPTRPVASPAAPWIPAAARTATANASSPPRRLPLAALLLPLGYGRRDVVVRLLSLVVPKVLLRPALPPWSHPGLHTQLRHLLRYLPLPLLLLPGGAAGPLPLPLEPGQPLPVQQELHQLHVPVGDRRVQRVLAPLLRPDAGGQLRALVQEVQDLGAGAPQDGVPQPTLELLRVFAQSGGGTQAGSERVERGPSRDILHMQLKWTAPRGLAVC